MKELAFLQLELVLVGSPYPASSSSELEKLEKGLDVVVPKPYLPVRFPQLAEKGLTSVEVKPPSSAWSSPGWALAGTRLEKGLASVLEKPPSPALSSPGWALAGTRLWKPLPVAPSSCGSVFASSLAGNHPGKVRRVGMTQPLPPGVA